MVPRWAVVVIILVIVVLVAVWWFRGIAIQQPTTPTPAGADFQPLIDDFESYPTSTWFGTEAELQHALSCSKYRYRIMLSDGSIFYDNRPKLPSEELFSTVEYVQAAAIGQGAVVRDFSRNLAERVSTKSIVRIVHVSAPLV